MTDELDVAGMAILLDDGPWPNYIAEQPLELLNGALQICLVEIDRGKADANKAIGRLTAERKRRLGDDA